MLIILVNSQINAQNLEKKETIYINDDSFSEVIIYNSKDSLYTDLVNKKIYLWGSAKVEMSGINMVAVYILIDLDKNELYRMGRKNGNFQIF